MPEHQQTQQSKKTNTIFQNQATPIRQTPVSNPYSIIQRAKINPRSLTRADIMQLQRTIGNQAVGRLLSSIGSSSTAQQTPVQRQEIPEEETCPSCVQRQEIPEEEEPLQGKMTETLQRQEIPEEEEPLQGKMIETVQRQEIPEEEEPLQGKFENKPEIACPSCFAVPIVQRQEIPEEEEPLQGKFETIQRQETPEEEEPLQGKFGTVQRQEIPEEEEPLQPKKENNTGMPDNLKAGVENLSGIDMSDVRVHYNSDKPAKVGALAHTQGTNIHVAPEQEKYLPHEAWHVVQQAQGRVRPTIQLKGVAINNDMRLEKEADEMGEKAENFCISKASGISEEDTWVELPIHTNTTQPLATTQRTKNTKKASASSSNKSKSHASPKKEPSEKQKTKQKVKKDMEKIARQERAKKKKEQMEKLAKYLTEYSKEKIGVHGANQSATLRRYDGETPHVHNKRHSYDGDRVRQELRHFSTVIFFYYTKIKGKTPEEIQAGVREEKGKKFILGVSSNVNKENHDIETQIHEIRNILDMAKQVVDHIKKDSKNKKMNFYIRALRHATKVLQDKYDMIKKFEERVIFPKDVERKIDGLHAELRLLENEFTTIAGVKRPCAACATELMKKGREVERSGPLWPSERALIPTLKALGIDKKFTALDDEELKKLAKYLSESMKISTTTFVESRAPEDGFDSDSDSDPEPDVEDSGAEHD